MSASRSARTSARRSSTASELASRICCHSAGSLAATRVTSRTPCPERARCSAGAAARRPATSTAARCGRWEMRATARSCSPGSITSGAAPHSSTSASTRRTASGRACGVRRDRPGTSVEEGRAGGEGSGALAAGHRVRADVAGEVVRSDPAGHLLERSGLDAADVGDDGSGAAQGVDDGVADRGGRHRHHDQLRSVVRRRRASRPEAVGGAEVLRGGVAQHDLDAEPAAHQGDRRADQARPDDLHRPGQGRQVVVSHGWWSGRGRGAGWPRRGGRRG